MTHAEAAARAVANLNLRAYVVESLTPDQLAADIETLASLVERLADALDRAESLLTPLR